MAPFQGKELPRTKQNIPRCRYASMIVRPEGQTFRDADNASMIVRPEGAKHSSPGQRPGNRNAIQTGSPERAKQSLCRPFRAKALCVDCGPRALPWAGLWRPFRAKNCPEGAKHSAMPLRVDDRPPRRGKTFRDADDASMIVRPEGAKHIQPRATPWGSQRDSNR